MKKKLLFLMTLALIGWSNVWAAAGEPSTVTLWVGSNSYVLKFTDADGSNKVYVYEGISMTYDTQYCLWDSYTNSRYGWSSTAPGAINNNNTYVDIANLGNVNTGTAWFGISTGYYDVYFDLSGTTAQIKFTLRSLEIDENATSAPTYTAGNYHPWINRANMSSEKWESVCFPFALDATDILWRFGNGAEGTQVAELTSENEGVLNFTTVTAMEANKPYLVKVHSFSNFTFEGRAVSAFEPVPVDAGDYQFVGTNVVTDLAEGDYYITNSKLRKATSTTTTKVKATRAYFKKKTGGSARALTFVIDGEVTAIDQVELDEESVSGPYFNLAGQRVAQPRKGVYIVNGKKVVIK